jgi:hypothetical protein
MAQAVPGYQITGWHGVAVRAAPPAAIDKLNATVNAIFRTRPSARAGGHRHLGRGRHGGRIRCLDQERLQRLGALVRSTGVTLDRRARQ